MSIFAGVPPRIIYASDNLISYSSGDDKRYPSVACTFEEIRLSKRVTARRGEIFKTTPAETDIRGGSLDALIYREWKHRPATRWGY